MSFVQEIINLNIGIDDTQRKYHYVPMSKEYRNYTRQKAEAYDLLSDLATGAMNSVFIAVRQTLKPELDRTIPKAVDKAVKQVVKENPNLTWTD